MLYLKKILLISSDRTSPVSRKKHGSTGDKMVTRRSGTPEFLGKFHSDVQENFSALGTYFGALGKPF